MAVFAVLFSLYLTYLEPFVIRALTLVLVNAEGQAVWKQDEGLSEESPLDLNQAERQIEALTINPKNKIA